MEHEPRKLIKFGNSSFIVSLPQKWVQKNSLKKGDIIYIDENPENELILNFKDKKIEKNLNKNILINVDGKDSNEINREMISAYINNYSDIIFSGKEIDSKKDMISKMLDLKVGVEIVEQSKNQIIAKDLLDMEAISVKNIARRMDNILRSMFEELKNGITENSFKGWIHREIYKIDVDLNKLYFLVWKIVRKSYEEPVILRNLKMNPLEISNLQWITLYLEYIGDEIKRVAKFLAGTKIDDKEKEILREIVGDIENSYLTAMTSYYKNNKDGLFPLMKEKYLILEKCEKLVQKSSNQKMYGLGERIKMMYSSVNNILKILSY
jgi:phosphate uptake regulator